MLRRMEATKSSSESDIRKLIRVRGGHRGAFTRLQTKVDAFIQQSIDDEEKLCEGEALLAMLQNKSLVVNRWDAEIALLIENEDELAAEMDGANEFEHKVSITIARLEGLLNNYKQQVNHQPRNSNEATNSVGSSSKLKLPKLQLPTFQVHTLIGCLL